MSKGTKIFFLSDLHLGAEKDSATKDKKYKKIDILFERILNEGQELFLLGDVFDFWYEYKHAIFSEYYFFLKKISL
jgi:UDP-2,3-diacylglucosamine hydrolase